jgi:hypothetical protein
LFDKKEGKILNLKNSIIVALFTICLTFLTNVAFKFLQNKFDFMTDTNKFKRDYYFKQLSELYIELYAIIIQSEFLRYFHKLNKLGSLKDIPFLEPINTRTKTKIDLSSGKVTVEKEVIETAISKFNKENLIELVLKKKHLASPELLKLIVAYRYCHEYYKKEDLDIELKEDFQKHEVELIYEIVVTIVKETNERLKFCKMDFNECEREYGVLDISVFDLRGDLINEIKENTEQKQEASK